VNQDITERKKAEETLRHEKERLAVTLRSIGDAVVTTDVQGRVTLMNKVAEGLTGWKEADAAGRALEEVFRMADEEPGQRREGLVSEMLRAGDGKEPVVRATLVSRDGTRRVIAETVAPIRDKDGQAVGLVLVFRDMTERQKMEDELLKVSKLDALGMLAGGLAHDFNNILTGILGNINLAKLVAPPMSEMVEMLSEAENASLEAKNLTHQLLTFARGGRPVKKIIDPGKIVRETAFFVARGSKVKCEFRIAADLHPVEADEGQITQVVSNIVINAVQAMPQGGTLEVSAENLAVSGGTLPLPAGPYVKLSLKDFGVGISAEHLPKIFDPYFSTKQFGSGLGLATSFSIVKKHGGHLTADSRLGEGTTFHIYLPASPGKTVARPPSERKVIRGSGRILVMDDDRFVRSLAMRLFPDLGYEADFAEDGGQAVEMFRKAREGGKPYAAVVLDLTVPGGMGGKEALSALREIDPAVKAVASSGYSNDPVMANHKEYGFAEILMKPYRMVDVAEVLHRLLTGA